MWIKIVRIKVPRIKTATATKPIDTKMVAA
jgi:hypothetical protein